MSTNVDNVREKITGLHRAFSHGVAGIVAEYAKRTLIYCYKKLIRGIIKHIPGSKTLARPLRKLCTHKHLKTLKVVQSQGFRPLYRMSCAISGGNKPKTFDKILQLLKFVGSVKRTSLELDQLREWMCRNSTELKWLPNSKKTTLCRLVRNLCNCES